MTHDEILKYVEDMYAASGSGDFDKVAGMLTEDFFVTEADGLPMEGIYRGRGALKELYTKVMGIMDVAGLDVVETTCGKDHAITILSLRFADPALKPAHLLELFRFRDGKCCEIRPYYFDPAPVHAAYQAKLAATASA